MGQKTQKITSILKEVDALTSWNCTQRGEPLVLRYGLWTIVFQVVMLQMPRTLCELSRESRDRMVVDCSSSVW